MLLSTNKHKNFTCKFHPAIKKQTILRMSQPFATMRRCVLLLLVNLIVSLPTTASEPFFLKNYTKQEYQAANQNWSVAQDTGGNLYFANHIGLLEFDGVTWTLYPSPGNALIRTVTVGSESRIFTAGYRELGFWERNELGRLVYHSLKKEVDQNFDTNEEFWNIVTSGNNVYFQSFSKIYVYDGQRFVIIKPDGFINSISKGGDRIFVNVMDRGIYQIVNNQLSEYLVDPFFNKKEIRFILNLKPNENLIGTSNGGLMLFDGIKLKEWTPEQTGYFRKNLINHGCVTADQKIVIGTILDGVSVFDYSGKLIYRINKQKGLQNNTVLGLLADANQNIWVALDEGIDFISFQPDPSYTIVERPELGAVYTAAVYNHKLYLGTNQGLYFKPETPDDRAFELVPGTQGQIWDCKVLDERLFINHNKNTFMIKGDRISRLANLSGGFSIIKNPLYPNKLVQSTYSNLIFYRKQEAEWQLDKIIYPFSDLIRYIEIDHFGNYWASHMYQGAFRLRFDQNDSLTYSRYYGLNTFGQVSKIGVFTVENRIVFTTGDKLYTYDDLKDTITGYDLMNEKLGKFRTASRIVSAPENRYWFITGEALGLFQIQNSSVKKIKEYPVALFDNRLIIGYENVVPLGPDEAILCLENGYALLNPNTISPTSQISGKKPELRRFTISGSNDQSADLPLKNDMFVLKNNRNNLQLRFSFPFFSYEQIKYQYLIEGLDQQWSESLQKPILNLKRVPVGNFKIRVKAINSWGESSQENVTLVEILPPWYWSGPAIFVYLLLILIGLYLFRRSIILRIRKKESRDHEDKERELIQLRNEKLQADLMFKSSELASSTMLLIKKNEFLMKVKETLHHHKEQLGVRYPDKYYDALVQKIDDNIANQDEWKVFEANFERAHEQFVKNLKENHKDLTPSDLRLCAFLRMNLSSKEIAPLLGISVRGVENHRYRLRKKLNLDLDCNLTDFIIQL
jgi:DNA-binding CsgD family transcriptional regulator